jgi:hypothetical protein
MEILKVFDNEKNISTDKFDNLLGDLLLSGILLGRREYSQIADRVEHVEEVLSFLRVFHAEIPCKKVQIVLFTVLIVQMDHLRDLFDCYSDKFLLLLLRPFG